MAGSGYAGPLVASGGGATFPVGFSGDPTRRVYVHNPAFSTTAVASTGDGAVTASVVGTASTSIVQSGQYRLFQLVNTASSFSNASVADNGGASIRLTNKPTFVCVLMPVTSASVIYTLGFNSGPQVNWINGLPGASGGNHAIEFRYKAGTDTNWQCITSNAVADTLTDSGVVFSTAAPIIFAIDATNTASIKFYINNVLVATNTLTLPGAVDMTSFVSVGNLTASATIGNIGTMRVEAF